METARLLLESRQIKGVVEVAGLVLASATTNGCGGRSCDTSASPTGNTKPLLRAGERRGAALDRSILAIPGEPAVVAALLIASQTSGRGFHFYAGASGDANGSPAGVASDAPSKR